jgi:hypothetical protein
MTYQVNWKKHLKVSLALIAAALLLLIFVHPVFAAAEKSSRAKIKQMVVEEAQNSAVPPALALAVAKVESDFNPSALSTAGARGVMQIMPKTAKDVFGVDEEELWKVRLNIQLGIDYLAKLRSQYGGKWELALSHYNGGTLKGKGADAEPHSFTANYVRMVQRWQQRYSDQNQIWAKNGASKGTAPRQTMQSVWADRDDEWQTRPKKISWRENRNLRWDDFSRRDYAFQDDGKNCRKASHKVAWHEYDRFSAPFTRGFNRHYARSNVRFRRTWRNNSRYNNTNYRPYRSYRRDRAGFYSAKHRYSKLEDRREQAAQSLDDFSSNYRRRANWYAG